MEARREVWLGEAAGLRLLEGWAGNSRRPECRSKDDLARRYASHSFERNWGIGYCGGPAMDEAFLVLLKNGWRCGGASLDEVIEAVPVTARLGSASLRFLP